MQKFFLFRVIFENKDPGENNMLVFYIRASIPGNLLRRPDKFIQLYGYSRYPCHDRVKNKTCPRVTTGA